MSKELRKHPREASNGHLRVRTSVSGVAYTVSLRDVSLGGAFVRTEHIPGAGEVVSFDILDEYCLRIERGQGKVVRVVDIAVDFGLGFAIQFDEDLESAMLDFLRAQYHGKVV